MVRAITSLVLLLAVPAVASPTTRVRELGPGPVADDDGAEGTVLLAQGAGEGSVGRSTDDGSTGNGKFKMTYIGFKNTADGSRIFARMNEPGAKFTAKKEGENLLVLEITDAFIPLRNNKNHLDTTFFESPVKMITPGEVEGTPTTIRIVIEMKEDVPFEQVAEGKDIVIFTKK